MLGEYRKNMKYTQKELAEKSGVSVRAIRDYEQGQRDLSKASAETVYRLAKTLQVSMEELIKEYLEEERK